MRLGATWIGLAGDDQVDDLAVREELRRRLVARHRQELLGRETDQVGEGVGTRRRMEHAELRDCARLGDAAQDADAGGGAAIAVQVLVPPELGSLVQPRAGAVGVVPVREQDGCDLDLLADRAFERLAHLRGGARRIAGVDDDPSVRRLDGEAVRNAPAAQRIHARGDLLGDSSRPLRPAAHWLLPPCGS